MVEVEFAAVKSVLNSAVELVAYLYAHGFRLEHSRNIAICVPDAGGIFSKERRLNSPPCCGEFQMSYHTGDGDDGGSLSLPLTGDTYGCGGNSRSQRRRQGGSYRGLHSDERNELVD